MQSAAVLFLTFFILLILMVPIGYSIGIATLFDLSSLLLCMAMGAVVANFSPDVTQIMDICDGVTPPIFLLFFVASGADLKLSVLPTVGLIGVIYIVLRVAGKAFGASLGGIVCKCDKNVKKYLGPCLLPILCGLFCCRKPVWPSVCRWQPVRSCRILHRRSARSSFAVRSSMSLSARP